VLLGEIIQAYSDAPGGGYTTHFYVYCQMTLELAPGNKNVDIKFSAQDEFLE
jgi:hypothetical protein